MKNKKKDPNKLPVLLDTNNPWQIVLIVLITLVLTASIRGGMWLIERYGYVERESVYEKYSGTVVWTEKAYQEMVAAREREEQEKEKERNSPVKKVETVKGDDGIYRPVPTEVPDWWREIYNGDEDYLNYQTQRGLAGGF